MRVYRAELKRILKTRSVQILLLAAIIISAVLAFFPVTFIEYTYENEAGQEIRLTGKEALRLIKEHQGEFQGEITEEKLADAVEQYRKFVSGYEGGLPDGIYDERVTAADYCENVSSYYILLNRMQEINADPDTGIAPGMDELTIKDADNFYGQCRQHLKDLIRLENGNTEGTQSAINFAEKLYDNVRLPFTYYPGIRMDGIEYIGLCVLCLVMIGMVIMIPLFASDRQTQADQIIKCARYGKYRLALFRILAGLTILTVMYTSGTALFLLILNSSYGWESLNTSVQIGISAVVFVPVTMGGLELLIVIAGYITLLATACFTLFLSGNVKSVFTAAIISFVFFLLPVICYMLFDGNVRNWICSLLPSGGTGLMNSFTYAVADAKFAFAGSHAIWVPYLMMAAALLEMILFCPVIVVNWGRKSR